MIVLDHKKLFPPPELSGAVSAVDMTDEGLQLTFNDNLSARFSPPIDSLPDSFIWLQSGDPKIFDIVINNANVLVRSETDEGLAFNLYDYRRQVASGHLTMDRSGTIVAYVPNQY